MPSKKLYQPTEKGSHSNPFTNPVEATETIPLTAKSVVRAVCLAEWPDLVKDWKFTVSGKRVFWVRDHPYVIDK
jgi:hypothetical protein